MSGNIVSPLLKCKPVIMPVVKSKVGVGVCVRTRHNQGFTKSCWPALIEALSSHQVPETELNIIVYLNKMIS